MIELILVCLCILFLIMFAEILWRRKIVQVELSRKLIHMGTGVIVAFCPFFLSWTYIQLLSVGFLVVILASYKLNIFSSIHDVNRITRGEVLYPIGIGICALLEPAPWIFTASILHLAIADALAAIVGLKWGKRTRYMLLSHGKTLLGSMTFFYTSMAIFAGALYFVAPENRPNLLTLLVMFPLILTLLENISWFGSDNITVPVAVIILLSVI